MQNFLPYVSSRGSLALLLVAVGAACACASSSDSAYAPGGQSTSDAGAPSDGSRSSTGASSDSGAAGPPATVKRAADPSGPDASACAALDSSKPATLYLSSDDSNSMASPVIARSRIRQGQQVPANLVRTYEFLNYYNVAYAPPAPGTLGLSLQARTGADPSDVELQIGVQSAPAASPRRAMNIVMVLDTSGSMQGKPIELEQAAVRAIASQLRAGDVISATTWNTNQLVVLDRHVASGPNDPAVLALASGLTADGGTDLDGGLKQGYALAELAFDAARINRVVLISDGIANVGQTNAALIGAKADDQDKEAIYLVGVGVGDGVNDTLMDVVTDAGRGAYVYLDDAQEAERMLGARFDEVMDVAARGVQVELTLPWYFQMKQFFGEEYSSDPKKVKPQHLAPGDSMVFEQIVRACDPAVRVASDPVQITARWVDPFDYSAKSVSTQKTFAELEAASAVHLLRGRAIVAFAEALKTQGTALPLALDKAVSAVEASDPSKLDAQLNEIRDLAGAYRRLLAP